MRVACSRSRLKVLLMIGVCFFGLASGMPALAQEWTATETDGAGEDYPRPVLPLGASSNIDFVSRLLMGNATNHALAYNASAKHLYVGFGPTFAILNVFDKAHPALLGWADIAPNSTINGLAYPGSGTVVYAAAGSAGLIKVNVSVPASPSVSATCYTPGHAWDLFLSGSQAFVADGAYGLRVIDTTTMTETTGYDTPGNATDVSVLGNYAYVADVTTLQILDITTVPPVLAGSLPTVQSRGVSAVSVGGSPRVFVADSGPPDLRIVDATNPALPIQVGSLNVYGSGMDVWVNATATTAFLANFYGGLRTVDVTNPSLPVETQDFQTTGSACGLVVVGTDVFIAATSSVAIVDTSSATPSLWSGYPCGSAYSMAVRGDYAYVGSSQGVVVMDIRVPERPRVVSRTQGGSVTDFSLVGNYIYRVASALFSIDDITDLTDPIEVFSGYTPTTAGGIEVSGDYAFIADLTSGLRVYDVSVPALAHEVGYLDTPGTAYGVCLLEDYAYVADFASGVQIIDVSNPSAPSLWSTLLTPGVARAVTVSGRYLYVAEEYAGIEIYDVADPPAPLWMGRFDTPGSAYSLTVAGGLAYVADSWSGLRVLDVSTPWAPAEVGFYDTDSNDGAAAFQDGYAFLAGEPGGAYMFHYSGACYDPYEANDFFAEAYAVTAGNLYDSKICTSGDYDYYALTITEGGTLNATMHPPSGLDFDLFLYSPAQGLIASSMTAGDATESVSCTTATAGTYTLLVRGHDGTQFSATQFYSLVPSFTSCASPTQALLIYMGRKDANDDVILDILDPNQPSVVTGYNIYRATVPNPGTWPLHAANVHDADDGTANVQYIDLGSHAGGPYYYLARAVNAACGGEGP